MRIVEGAPARIEDAYEVDGGIAARKALSQGFPGVHVELDELALRDHEQMPVPLSAPREHACPVARPGQSAH